VGAASSSSWAASLFWRRANAHREKAPPLSIHGKHVEEEEEVCVLACVGGKACGVCREGRARVWALGWARGGRGSSKTDRFACGAAPAQNTRSNGSQTKVLQSVKKMWMCAVLGGAPVGRQQRKTRTKTRAPTRESKEAHEMKARRDDAVSGPLN